MVTPARGALRRRGVAERRPPGSRARGPAALLACVVILTVTLPPEAGAAPRGPTVGDYLARVARAAGLGGFLPPHASPEETARVLVQRGLLHPRAARLIALDARLTREEVKRLAGALGPGLPAPTFLSSDYVNTLLAESQAEALGIFDEDEDELGKAVGGPGIKHKDKKRDECPTPRKRKGKGHRKCKRR